MGKRQVTWQITDVNSSCNRCKIFLFYQYPSTTCTLVDKIRFKSQVPPTPFRYKCRIYLKCRQWRPTTREVLISNANQHPATKVYVFAQVPPTQHKKGNNLKCPQMPSQDNGICFLKCGQCCLAPRGGTLIFSPYVGSGPASTVYPKKDQEFQAPQNNIWNFSNPKKYPPFGTLPLRKDPKMHRNDPKYRPILWWPQNIIRKIFIPKKIFNFRKTQKNIEIQNFEPQKITWAYVYIKISE